MTPRSIIVATDRIHLDELIQFEIESQGNAADLNHIDVSRIQVMNILFLDSPFVGDISKWDTSGVVDMSRMFQNCPFNNDISQWNTSRVNFMLEMFYNGSFQGSLHGWDTSNATSMESMFRGSNNNPRGLENWNVSRVESFFRMFKGSQFVNDLSKWSPANDAYSEAMVDRTSLVNMPTPCFYHWYRVLGDQDTGADMPAHLLTPPQGTDSLRPEWKEHLKRLMPLADGLGLSDMPCVRFIQEQWLEAQKPSPDAWPLPSLETT